MCTCMNKAPTPSPYPCPRDFDEDGFNGGLAETHCSGYLDLTDITEVLWKEGDCLEGREGGRKGREEVRRYQTLAQIIKEAYFYYLIK